MVWSLIKDKHSSHAKNDICNRITEDKVVEMCEDLYGWSAFYFNFIP